MLEKSYFCSITNSYLDIFITLFPVVICLKNRTFAVSQTATRVFIVRFVGLWFAWKIVLLQYHKQPPNKCISIRISCDLLEKSYFCSITNSSKGKKKSNVYVVICLKNRTFAVSQTAFKLRSWPRKRLWFAWKIVLLQYHKQLDSRLYQPSNVVICLKNRTFAVSQTAARACSFTSFMLWFAWKIVLLQYHKQLISV